MRSRLQLRRDSVSALLALALMTLLLGVLYPLAVTGLAQALLPSEANGSLIVMNERAVASALIGQRFSRPDYFWGRPSAIATPYDARTSSGSNLGPNNPALRRAVAERLAALREAHPQGGKVPIDLVSASASGLDPHITPAAAYYQVARVARARGVSEGELKRAVDAAVERRWLGVFGELRVNVVRLNLSLHGSMHPEP